MSARRSVLVVDDEAQIRRVLRVYLEADGFTVVEAGTGAEALTRAVAEPPGIVLLDVGLPDIDGLEVLRRLRAGTDVFVILVTARGEEVDKLVGLAVGADDYITKPFSPREVVARVNTVLRRTRLAEPASTAPASTAPPPAVAEEEVRAFPGLVIDARRREVLLHGGEVTFSTLEFDLIWALADDSGRVFSRAQLLERVWGYDFYGDERVVDVHVRNIRRLLGDDATQPTYIGTVRGVGYKFLPRPLEAPSGPLSVAEPARSAR